MHRDRQRWFRRQVQRLTTELASMRVQLPRRRGQEQLAAVAPTALTSTSTTSAGTTSRRRSPACAHGRIAACGAISRYNDETRCRTRNLFLFVTRRLTMRGFIVSDWSREMKTFLTEVSPLVASGVLRP
jgi:hypothetical protein